MSGSGPLGGAGTSFAFADLTTTFTPAPGCSDLWSVFVESLATPSTTLLHPSTTIGTKIEDIPDCFPSADQINSYTRQWPAICPVGWTTVTAFSTSDGPRAICCPNGLTYFTRVGNGDGCTSVGTTATNIRTVLAEDTTVTVAPVWTKIVEALFIGNWNSIASVSTAAATTGPTLLPSITSTGNVASSKTGSTALGTQTSLSSSAAGGLPNGASSSGTSTGLSTGAKAGIAVGAILGVLLIVGMLLFFLLRRRRKHETDPPHPDFLELDTSRNFAELDAATEKPGKKLVELAPAAAMKPAAELSATQPSHQQPNVAELDAAPPEPRAVPTVGQESVQKEPSPPHFSDSRAGPIETHLPGSKHETAAATAPIQTTESAAVNPAIAELPKPKKSAEAAGNTSSERVKPSLRDMELAWLEREELNLKKRKEELLAAKDDGEPNAA
jgi:hypothetical protein